MGTVAHTCTPTTTSRKVSKVGALHFTCTVAGLFRTSDGTIPARLDPAALQAYESVNGIIDGVLEAAITFNDADAVNDAMMGLAGDRSGHGPNNYYARAQSPPDDGGDTPADSGDEAVVPDDSPTPATSPLPAVAADVDMATSSDSDNDDDEVPGAYKAFQRKRRRIACMVGMTLHVRMVRVRVQQHYYSSYLTLSTLSTLTFSTLTLSTWSTLPLH